MTLSKKANWTTALRKDVRHRTVKPARRAYHRRGVAAASPAIQISVDRAQLAELRDWGILAGVSLTGWIVTAIAIGAV